MRQPADLPNAREGQTGDAGGNTVRRCPECGAMFQFGEKRCEFCGFKLRSEDHPKHPRRAGGKPALAAPLRLVAAVGAVCLILAVAVVLRNNAAKRGVPEPPRQVQPDVERQAYQVCEQYIRRHPPATFSVTSVASGLVAKEREGFTVSGTVELQDPAGAPVRRRFSCTVLSDPRSGMRVDKGRIF